MKALRILGNVIGALVGALLGNWLGDQLRGILRGEPAREWQLLSYDEQGQATLAANVVLSNFIPALAVGALLKPHWLWSLISGAAISALLGEDLEKFIDGMLAPAENTSASPPCP
ncbi:MAG: hypothetical protein JXA37_09200 [Chloroflexia bacterium]|nr:hypothetical protein [Chloroflexia bacterium]